MKRHLSRMTSAVSARKNSSGEFRVRFFVDGVHLVGADYFTSRIDDAIRTSILQCHNHNSLLDQQANDAVHLVQLGKGGDA